MMTCALNHPVHALGNGTQRNELYHHNSYFKSDKQSNKAKEHHKVVFKTSVTNLLVTDTMC